MQLRSFFQVEGFISAIDGLTRSSVRGAAYGVYRRK
jgi:hypothetical protein